MGNVPISCCRSKSPRSSRASSNWRNSGNHNRGTEGQYSSTNNQEGSQKTRQSGELDSTSQPSHILQHISEREPDDSETDPSSNPLNRPIFATRSSNAKNKFSSMESYSSNSSNLRKQISTLLTSSQDHGYNSNASTNLTQYDVHLNDSFDNSIPTSQKVQRASDRLMQIEQTNQQVDNQLLLFDSPSNSENVIQCSPSVDRFNLGIVNTRVKNNLVKSSSCSTIFTNGSTISQPDLMQTIKCVSLAIYYHIKDRTSDFAAEIFDESIHPLKMPNQITTETNDELFGLGSGEENLSSKLDEPNQKTIYNFVDTLFKAAQLTSEYAITTLVYLERLMTYSEMDLTPKTWRRMFLGAILLSSKVWEDHAVWNVDYAQILEEISVEDINELERQFLELIQFNSNVPSSVYAKYYFHLRTLALKRGLSKEQKLLTIAEAKALEATSRAVTGDWHSPIQRRSSSVLKRHTSLEKLRLNGRSKAVLM